MGRLLHRPPKAPHRRLPTKPRHSLSGSVPIATVATAGRKATSARADAAMEKSVRIAAAAGGPAETGARAISPTARAAAVVVAIAADATNNVGRLRFATQRRRARVELQIRIRRSPR
jgi:hypothetical protein